jgi:hypothetical protein
LDFEVGSWKLNVGSFIGISISDFGLRISSSSWGETNWEITIKIKRKKEPIPFPHPTPLFQHHISCQIIIHKIDNSDGKFQFLPFLYYIENNSAP